MFSYVSFVSTEYATGTDGNSFPLANRTTFKFVFDESLNSLHLSGSHGIFSSIINAFELEQNTKPLSLKKSKVNLRVGPSFEHPVKLIYKKKYLPVEVLDKSETWRKIKDFENNSGWIHISQLSKKKTAINIKNNSIIHNKSTIYSKPIVRLEIGRLFLIKKCKVKCFKVVSGDFTG